MDNIILRGFHFLKILSIVFYMPCHISLNTCFSMRLVLDVGMHALGLNANASIDQESARTWCRSVLST